MSANIGPLTPADESFHHQIADTFATTLHTDPTWTEKVCLSVGHRGGELQLGFGLGKYINRNVMDGYAGISRGLEQRTVRASRQLWPDADRTSVGPIHYEVVEPLKKLRIRCDENDAQPIAFDVLLDCSAVPPFLENREHRRELMAYRVHTELVRYHQVGVPTGWVSVEGTRNEIDPAGWYASRDHSWGVRWGVGHPSPDLRPAPYDVREFPLQFAWCPVLFEPADAEPYSIHFFYLVSSESFIPKQVQGGIERADGTREPFVDVDVDLRYHPDNRRVLGGVLTFKMADGAERPLEIEVVGDTGFHLGTGLYFGMDGLEHGQWRGELNVEGERFEDCSDPAVARRIHQIRDTIVRVRDGDNVGIGNLQSTVWGGWPSLGLDGETSFT